ncbi:major capsid protein [Neorhizobium galegae]|uniref:major capsid protein n=1 Tax=Neorhizobium galegae TaxID=399 RepID=UPI00210602D3|nr:major capsid protein [Neorhizobium galegae]MCQ1856025.1 major capsid protein [Neorhizobium galegae]
MVMLNAPKGDTNNLIALTGAINERPYVVQLLDLWLPWNSKGESVDTLWIEFDKDGTLSLIEEQPRGYLGDPSARTERSGFAIKVPYYPQFETLLAAGVQGVRAFGSENESEGYQQKLNDLLDLMKRKNSNMREFIRMGALLGEIRKASGGISQNLNQLFGITRTAHAFDLSDPTTDVVAELIEAKEMAEDELGDFQAQVTGYKLIAGKNIHRKLTRHASVKDAFALWSSTSGFGNQGSAMRDDMRAGFPIASDIDIVSYSKGKVGSTYFLDPDKAILCPIVDGMYQTRYAPGDNKDLVNTIGLPEYAQSQELPFKKGDQVHTEMSTVSYVERPKAIVDIASSED